MTKNVHIINGDTSNWKVKVLIQDRVYDYDKGEFTNEWTNSEVHNLDNPGQLLTRYLTSSRRILIVEDGPK